ncbi:VPS4-associated protein 1 [Russula brevipes]|nr:VPS4-associated protein 1 [Russula brevipes]
MSFQNVYFKRATATPRACYVCCKPSTVCLATANAVDFLYTCEAHLSDAGFATELPDPGAAAAPAPKPAVSKEEIARGGAEEGQDQDKETDAGGGEGGEKGEKSVSKSPSPPIPGGPSSSSVAGSGAATPTHKRYSLHRDFYAMRQGEHRRKRQTKQMQELVPRLPGAPHGPPVS